MENIIVVVILAAIAVGAICYIARAKKSGAKCVGCPYAKSCRGGCSQHSEKKD